MKEENVQEKWETDLKVDKFALEEECEKQASLFTKYALEYVDQLYNLDKAKLDLDSIRSACKMGKEVIYSEVEMEIRRQYNTKGVKVTEAQIKSSVLLDKSYQERVDDLDRELREAEEGYVEQKAVTEEAQAKKEGMKQKKDMVGHMIFLWGADYFADPPTESKTVEQMNFSTNLKKPMKRREKK